MRFAIDGYGAQAAGQGLGNLLGAVFQGGYAREQAQHQAAARAAQTYANNMQGNKYGAEAEGLGITNQHRQAPIDESLPQHMQTLQKLFQWDSNNIEPLSKAMLNAQAATHRGNAVANPEMAPAIGQAYAAIEGRPLVTNVGNTGRTMNHFTGVMDVQDEVLAKLFGDIQSSQAAQNYAQANNANASAGFTQDKRNHFAEKGALPGTGTEGSEGALTNTVLRTLQIPALDAKGRPVRNPMTGEVETTTDVDALNSYYAWLDANGRKPSATSFTQWEARGRPGVGVKPSAPAAPSSTVGGGGNNAALENARAAIARGAPRDKVIERLKQNGIDPTGL